MLLVVTQPIFTSLVVALPLYLPSFQRTEKINRICYVDRFRRSVVDDLGLRKLRILQKIFQDRANMVRRPQIEGPCRGFGQASRQSMDNQRIPQHARGTREAICGRGMSHASALVLVSKQAAQRYRKFTEVGAEGDVSKLLVQCEVVLQWPSHWTAHHACKIQTPFQHRQVDLACKCPLLARPQLEHIFAIRPPARQHTVTR